MIDVVCLRAAVGSLPFELILVLFMNLVIVNVDYLPAFLSEAVIVLPYFSESRIAEEDWKLPSFFFVFFPLKETTARISFLNPMILDNNNRYLR